MKRVTRFLALLALCLALVALPMGALPMGALAEQMNVGLISLTDPIVYMNDTPYLDMTGLTVNLSGGTTADQQKAIVQVQVLGGEEAALAALASVSDGKLVLTADGLSSTYAYPLEQAQQAAVSGNMDMDAMKAFAAAVQGLGESEELMADVVGTVQEFVEQFNANMQDEGMTTYSMLSGEADVQHFSVEVTEEMTDELMTNLLTALDENPEFAVVIDTFVKAFNVQGLEERSLLNLYRQAGVRQKMDVDLYAKEDGSGTAVEMIQYVSSENEDDAGEMHWRFIFENNGGSDMDMYMDVDVYKDGQPEQGVYLRMETQGAAMAFEFGSGVFDGDEFENETTVLMSVQSVDVNGVNATQCNMSIDSNGQTVDAAFVGYTDNGEIYLDGQAESNGTTLSLNFEGEQQGEDVTGTLSLKLGDENFSYGLATGLTISSTAVDSDTVILSADGAIDLSDLEGEGMQGVMNELSALLINGVSVLDRNVPGLSGLMGMLLGSVN